MIIADIGYMYIYTWLRGLLGDAHLSASLNKVARLRFFSKIADLLNIIESTYSCK